MTKSPVSERIHKEGNMQVIEQLLEQGERDVKQILKFESTTVAGMLTNPPADTFVAAASGPVEHPETRDIAVLGYD